MAGAATSFFFGTLILLGFMLVLSFGFLQSQGHETKTKITITGDDHRSWTSVKLLHHEGQVKVLWKGKSSVAHPKQDLDYMSKRRVPNGPDPIHNRDLLHFPTGELATRDDHRDKPSHGNEVCDREASDQAEVLKDRR